jgi:hypothetical protein
VVTKSVKDKTRTSRRHLENTLETWWETMFCRQIRQCANMCVIWCVLTWTEFCDFLKVYRLYCPLVRRLLVSVISKKRTLWEEGDTNLDRLIHFDIRVSVWWKTKN